MSTHNNVLTHVPGPQFLDTASAASLVGLSRRSLEGMRVTGGGPPFRRHGRRIFYDLTDLIAWSESSKRTTTSDSGPAEASS